MRLVFVGSTRFGLRCLELALRIPEVSVVGIVTAPETFRISYAPGEVRNVLHVDFAPASARCGAPVEVMRQGALDPGLLGKLREWKPQAFLVVGWYHMIPRSWREMAPAYGLHASLLPDYSGGAPLVWAMINGESRTGITLFQMDDGVDSGPIVAQLEEPILGNDTIASLYSRVEQRGLELLDRALPELASGKCELSPQATGMRRVMPQRSPSDGLIDWTWDSTYIDRWIRAQTRPYPGAFTVIKGQRLIIWRAAVCTDPRLGKPGMFAADPSGVCRVQCGTGGLLVLEADWADQTGSMITGDLFRHVGNFDSGGRA